MARVSAACFSPSHLDLVVDRARQPATRTTPGDEGRVASALTDWWCFGLTYSKHTSGRTGRRATRMMPGEEGRVDSSLTAFASASATTNTGQVESAGQRPGRRPERRAASPRL